MGFGWSLVLWLSCRDLPVSVLGLSRPWLDASGAGMLLPGSEAAKHEAGDKSC